MLIHESYTTYFPLIDLGCDPGLGLLKSFRGDFNLQAGLIMINTSVEPVCGQHKGTGNSNPYDCLSFVIRSLILMVLLIHLFYNYVLLFLKHVSDCIIVFLKPST